MKRIGLSFTHNVFWTTIAALSQGISAFILVTVFVRLGDGDKYGIWSLLIATTSIVGLIATLRLSDAMVRLMSGISDARHKEQRFFSNLAVALILSVPTAMFFANWQWFLERFFDTNTDARAVQVGLFLIVAEALEWVALDSFRTFNRLRAYAYTIILRTWSLVLIVFIFLYFSISFVYLIATILILRIGITSLAMINIASVEKMSLKRWFRELDIGFLPGYLSYSIPMLCAGVFTLILSSGDRLILSYFEGVSAVGVYSAAYIVGSLGILIIGPIQMSLYPSLSRFWNTQNYNEAKAYAKLTFEYFVLLAVPATIGISLLADIIINILTATSISQVGWPVVTLVAIGVFFYGIHSIALLIITLSKRVWTIALIVATFGILNILLNILLLGVFKMGLLGAATATMLSFFFMALVSSSVAYQYLQFEIDVSFILKVVVASLAMAFVLYLFQNTPLWGRLLSAIIGTTIYFLFLTLTNSVFVLKPS